MAGRLGRRLAEERLTLVYGGGGTGLMGSVADAVLAAGGKAIGVIPHALATAELAHAGLTELRRVDTMHERKSLMAELADGFIAMPGGLGTFEEFFEILTWQQLGIHAKPCGLLNVAGYYDQLIAFLDHSVACGFVKPAYRGMILAGEDPQDLLQQMRRYQPPERMRWITPSQT